ncbi:MAG: hypothetical protein M1837_002102 [Sclerophora amabilis]|nr:MAG: hypothetical protein M1837_002102 [Sclerophora amabilis]
MLTSGLSSISHPHMPPPSRSPGHQTPVSPQKSVRDDYITSTPHVLRHPRPPRSPVDLISGSSHSSLTTTPRSIISPSTVPPPSPGHGFRHPLDPGQLESSAHGLGQSATSPPLYRTNIIHQIRTADGQMIRAEIDAQIDKGFFLADQEWTCYRRNYFSVACSYSLKPPMAPGPLYLRRSDNTQAAENISAFAMSISAVVDGAEGKPIDLVQHTPKRDKGPQGKPDRITLSPYPAGSMGMFPGNSSTTGSLLADPRAVRKHEYDPPYSQQGTQPQTIANFERIQFKSATANNGKRRAAQQYYNLIVELYANVGSSMSSEGQWIKVATRMSASMVVRGRSPGHYQEDRRASSSSTGPGGPAARDNGRGPSTGSSGPSSVNRSIGDPMSLMSGSGSMLGGGGYQGANGLSFHHSPSSMDSHPLSSRSSSGGHLENSIDPIIPSEETNAMDEGPGYQYYPSPLYESDGNHTRPAQSLPSFMPSIYRDDRSGGMPHGHYDGQLTRQDHGLDNKRNMREDYGGGFNLPQPSLLRFPGAFPSKEYGRADVFRSSCSRFQGTDTSRGHYPDLPAL